jgi:hypothetical protein
VLIVYNLYGSIEELEYAYAPLRNALISVLAVMFSITAMSCGRQALSPTPPQNPIQEEKKITIMETDL